MIVVGGGHRSTSASPHRVCGRNDDLVMVLFLFPAHRAPVSAKIVGMKTGVAGMDIAGTQVHYDR